MARIIGESRLRARRRRARLWRIGFVVAGVVCLIAACTGLLWASFWRVRTVVVVGGDDLAQEIQQLAWSHLTGTHRYVIPNNNIFLYPEGAIEQSLVTQFPLLSRVSIHRQGLHTLTITVAERQMNAVWCPTLTTGTTTEMAVAADCFAMDASGVVYSSMATQASSTALLVFTSPAAPQTLPWQFLSAQQVESLSQLVMSIAKNQIPNDPVVDVDVDTVNNDVYIMFQSGFTLLFDLNDDSGDVYNRLSLALTADSFTQHPIADFSYLDLRFGDKLYYKLKSQ